MSAAYLSRERDLAEQESELLVLEAGVVKAVHEDVELRKAKLHLVVAVQQLVNVLCLFLHGHELGLFVPLVYPVCELPVQEPDHRVQALLQVQPRVVSVQVEARLLVQAEAREVAEERELAAHAVDEDVEPRVEHELDLASALLVRFVQSLAKRRNARE